MESVWSVSKLSTESVGSRRELVANCVHTADADQQFRRVGGVYWALRPKPRPRISVLEYPISDILPSIVEKWPQCTLHRWLGSVVVTGRRARDRKIASSTPGRCIAG